MLAWCIDPVQDSQGALLNRDTLSGGGGVVGRKKEKNQNKQKNSSLSVEDCQSHLVCVDGRQLIQGSHTLQSTWLSSWPLFSALGSKKGQSLTYVYVCGINLLLVNQ